MIQLRSEVVLVQLPGSGSGISGSGHGTAPQDPEPPLGQGWDDAAIGLFLAFYADDGRVREELGPVLPFGSFPDLGG